MAVVIEDYGQSFGEPSARLEQGAESAARLKALLGWLTVRQERLASYGSPVGSLAAELAKRDGGLRGGAGAILAGWAGWAETQFRAMGREDGRELAMALIASCEGIVLLAAALQDPA